MTDNNPEVILNIHVRCTAAYETKTLGKTVNQVLFDGTADGPFFDGIILPGGVDTQVYENNTGHLSARYTLEGTGPDGKKCRIFIDNEAVTGEEYTHPSLFTDSGTLSWMNNTEFKGRIQNDADGLLIQILR